MVDKDRLNELRNRDSGNKKKKKKKKKKEKKKKSGGKKEKKKTKKDKLQDFKQTKSTPSSSGSTDDIKILLFTLANMDAYTRTVIEYDVEGLNPAQSRVKEDFAKDVAGEITNFLGVFGVKDITSKYGYQWKNILQIALENQDMSGQSMKTNSGDVDRDDIKELLDCVANVMLFVEGTVLSKKDKNKKSMKDKAIIHIGQNMHNQYESIISHNEIQKLAERHGFDWQSDVVEDVLSNQDFGDKLEK